MFNNLIGLFTLLSYDRHYLIHLFIYKQVVACDFV